MAQAVARRNNRYRSYVRSVDAASYDGNAARVLDGAEVLQPRPEVRTRERAVERPRVQAREAGKISLFAVVGFLAIGVFAALVLLSSVRMAALSDEVVALNSQLTALQSEEAKLRAKYELAFDIAEIEQQLTASGAMVKPQSSQIIYLDLSEPDSVVLFQAEPTHASGLQGALNSVQAVFGDLVEYFR